MKRYFPLALVLSFCMAPLHGATLQQLSMNDLIVKSTAIVHGKVASSSASFSGKLIYTHYAVQVSEQFKGGNQTSIDVVVPGGTVGNLRQSFSGTPSFNVGDDYVFFLWTSRAGLTQVLGLTQGLFSVAQDGSSDPATTRTASHEPMLSATSGQQVKDQTLTMKLSQLRALIAATLGTSTPGGNQ
ncbi:MAG: hypothetical protein ACLQU1_42020 [Bryobacteraceae bacterium]